MVRKSKGRLVILTGIDGCGKSTVLQGIAEKGYVVSHWRNLESHPGIHLNFKNPAEEVRRLTGDKRLNFIKKYILSEWKYLIKLNIERGVDVVSDGFFIRFYAKESIYKKMPLEKLIKTSPLTGKELIIFIDIPPPVAFQRKRGLKISPYEYYDSQSDFITFQQRQKEKMLEFTNKFPREVVNGLLPKDKLLAKVIGILTRNSIKKVE